MAREKLNADGFNSKKYIVITPEMTEDIGFCVCFVFVYT